MNVKTVADLLIETMLGVGVERIYGLPGDSLNGLTDVLRSSGAIEWVHVRHEETAAFTAAGEAHMTGTLAVGAGSCGPGNTHLINGLYDAHRSRVPVLAIAARIPSGEIGTITSRRLIRNCCSRNAATTARWCRARTNCRARLRSRSARRSACVVSRLSSFPVTC